MTCACEPYHRAHEMHELGEQMYADESLIVSDTCTHGQLLVHKLTIAIRQPRGGKPELTSKLHHLASRKAWLYNTKQILPHGPEGTICGYMDWLAGDDIEVICKTISTFVVLVSYAWPLVLPVMVKQRTLPQQFIEAEQRWTLDFTIKFAHQTGNHIQPQFKDYTFCILALFVQISTLIHVVCHDYANPSTATYFLRLHHKAFLISSDNLVRVLSQARDQQAMDLHRELIERLVLVGGMIYDCFPEHRANPARLTTLHRPFLAGAAPLRVPNIMVWRKMVTFLVERHVGPYCAAPGCTINTEQFGRSFRICTGCRWVHYCSRACQRKAWSRTDGLQHHDVCRMIRRIRIRYNIPRRSDVRDQMDYDPGLSQEDVLVTNTIIAHFEALTMYEIEGQE
jgi:hypothetical protein